MTEQFPALVEFTFDDAAFVRYYTQAIENTIRLQEALMLNVQSYVRKPFEVTAVQVTRENIDLVASWCNGKVVGLTASGADENTYVDVKVHRPQTPRHAHAHVGDWVLASGDPKRPSFKVYLEKAFPKAFDLKGDGGNRVQRGKEQLTELLTTDEPVEAINKEAADKVINGGDSTLAAVVSQRPAVSAAPSPAFLAALAQSRNEARS